MATLTILIAEYIFMGMREEAEEEGDGHIPFGQQTQANLYNINANMVNLWSLAVSSLVSQFMCDT